MRRKSHVWMFVTLTFLVSSLTSCSTGGNRNAQASDQQQKPDYNQTKSMMLDILHSKEGRDTLTDIMKEPTFKKNLVVTEQDVSSAIVKTLNNDQTQKRILEAQMTNPNFAATMVKASKQEQQKMLKQLMKDPEYQNSILTLMKSPDYQRLVLTTLESPEYRQQTMKILAESLQNPEFKLIFMDIVKEAIRSGAGVSKTGGQQGGKQQGGQDGQQQGNQSGGSSEQSDGGDGGGQDDQQKKKKEE
ncbi:spore germination lipoprotein GerD [Effusibacillus dendaii]|uniref:Germination protein GerD n=1 Tax=Effusibacillus dendaii TaxID=2743772 RepID=A0A7I8DAT2_9BACL|nr:spore germination lipoprotein GerD [Effusibacillus dendaii]BCJ87298.1 germination protein GerD [Effusibacillus dendaii]